MWRNKEWRNLFIPAQQRGSMVDLRGGVDSTPPVERMKRLRALEAEKRKTLEEEIIKKKKELEEEIAKKKKAVEEEEIKRKKELEETERKTKAELAETEAQEQKTLRDAGEEILRRQEELKALEERLKEFRESKSAIPDEAQRHGIAAGYQERPVFEETRQGLDYLLNAKTSEERRLERERNLYRNVRWIAEELKQGKIEESYAFNQFREQVHELQQRGHDPHNYVRRIANVLNSIIDYHQEDRRQQQ